MIGEIESFVLPQLEAKQLSLTVSRAGAHDTGLGIPESSLGSIFEQFVQVTSYPAGRPNDGIGLGLAISRELARSMKGDLTVTSTVGEGSTFTLMLPVA